MITNENYEHLGGPRDIPQGLVLDMLVEELVVLTHDYVIGSPLTKIDDHCL